MEIHRATPDDARNLAKVLIDSWRSAYYGLVPDSYLDNLDYEERAQRFRMSLTHNYEETYIFEQNGQILGFLTLGECRDEDIDQKITGEIWGIYLAPEQWRKGMGTIICRHGERILESREYRLIMLWVFGGNEQARKFYESMGFIADGTSKTLMIGIPLEAVRYRKELGVAEPIVSH